MKKRSQPTIQPTSNSINQFLNISTVLYKTLKANHSTDSNSINQFLNISTVLYKTLKANHSTDKQFNKPIPKYFYSSLQNAQSQPFNRQQFNKPIPKNFYSSLLTPVHVVTKKKKVSKQHWNSSLSNQKKTNRSIEFIIKQNSNHVETSFTRCW